MCGNAIAAIEAAISGWETEDEEDFNNAMCVYNTIILNKNEQLPPVLLGSEGVFD